jgi:hypothetical protein
MDFPDICTISPYVSEDGHQTPTYGTSFQTICKYEEVQEVNQEKGIDITSGWLALPPETTINKNKKDKITLEDGEEPQIKKIRRIRSPASNDVEYIRVILGTESEGV